ncbi:phosphoribosylaminoimidazolesuccinocarboxamide synthase [Pelagibaculum spongiae]|uniref:Phosphoribosylaminoimidazole-succinocarboxamide synthase n=1 Tax=Pelagibaculum spongiae TaxID=2080658 RepID=A0A2V1GVE4_9GAMM|nr:phosphoribosylaminoimidazolesuccinocarboxamide synthase [Pelagibaculum spongiae]PVZ69661.1 phosphoribosylaminoimidazolesuccinocarboxamide synthase [Pelagibaculum spongiae]
MEKRDELYAGKAKSVFTTDNPELVIIEYRNDTSAFDGAIIEQLNRKGLVNNYFNAFIMQQLAKAGIPVHQVELLSETESLVKRLDMVPVECVVRNRAAGSICKRLGVKEGLELTPPTFEFFLKNDALHDPMINEHHIESFGWADKDVIAEMKALTFKINDILKPLFAKAGLILVDYKLEFGVQNGQVYLGDEFSPDGCRLWDAETLEKMDKDRFRQGLGGVIEAYEEVARRIGCELP